MMEKKEPSILFNDCRFDNVTSNPADLREKCPSPISSVSTNNKFKSKQFSLDPLSNWTPRSRVEILEWEREGIAGSNLPKFNVQR